ncbi:MAG: universal stress protein [Spirochaetales bacterium]|uniref:Universal stress protein n=1 Tax=Candidatus Thalassospirochaeta sargassi TaxID=3119039 RepID=A0AAJ1MKJ1_9SPIO|nr:universal stress protein [Spirochaetales bacterium]
MKGPIKNILVYIDGSEASISAAMYGIALSKSTGAALTALYVINTRALNDLLKARIFIQEEEAEYHRDLEDDAGRYLNHVKKLAEQKEIEIKTVSKSGTIHREIKTEIKENGYDLLILGGVSSIRSRRDEFFNETDRAMRSVNCPVLIIKDEDSVWEIFESI